MENNRLDRIIDRRCTNSIKWDLRGEKIDEGLIPMWVADMDFPCPDEVVDALSTLAERQIFGYSLAGEEFFSSFIGWQKRRHEWSLERDWLVFTPGVMEAVRNAIEAHSKEGGTVVLQSPVYYPFYDAIEGSGRKVAINRLRKDKNGYVMNLDDLERLFSGPAEVLLLCSPHNPVGRVWTLEELDELNKLCIKYNITVISDEIHADLLMPGEKFIPFALVSEDAANRSVSCLSGNKTFNIAGLSSAHIVIANDELRTAFKKRLHASGRELPNLASCTAAAAGFNSGDQWLDEIMSYIAENAQYLRNVVEQGRVPANMEKIEGTFLAWLDFSSLGLSDKELSRIFLEKAKLWLQDGAKFGPGGEGHMRMNIACPRSLLEEAVDRISRCFA